jgi:uncharacterized repeat protein (TIGR01451 family)
MKKFIVVIAVLIFILILVGSSGNQVLADFQAQKPNPQDIIPINGTAYWATAPTGPDFQGVTLIPFQAQNPTREVYDATRMQILPYLTDDFNIDNIQVSASGIITGAPYFVNDFSEVMVYLDPTNPNHLLGASKFFYIPASYLFYTGVFESYDGGLTWTELQPPGVSTYSLTSDPVTTFDDQGNGFFTLLTRGPTGVDMLKKPFDGGWMLPVVVDRTTSTDKQWIMGDQDPQSISPYAGNLYMSWTSFGGPVTGIVLSRSIDGNASWSPPISLTDGDIQGSIPGVVPDGTVYVVFGRSIFFGPTPGTIEFVKSTNGGVTFGAPAVAANITAIPYELPDPFGFAHNFRSPASLPAFAVSPTNGNLYIAWADYRNGDSDIYFASSTNGGTNWTTPVRLNDDPLHNGIDQFQPQVSVAPNGRVAVMWFDRRLPCPDLPWIPSGHIGMVNACIDTFVTRSYNDGQSWTANARASAQTWDWTINLPLDGGGNGFIGDYQGIASNNEYDFPFWNATANLGENAQNYQEVFVARMPVPYFNLSSSDKSVTPDVVLPGGTLAYTITLENLGLDNDPAVILSDSVPISTTFITGSLVFPSGSGGYDPSTNVITWTGGVDTGQPIQIRFQVSVAPDALDGQQVVNNAIVHDGAGTEYSLVANATVNVNPIILSTIPAEGDNSVPITSTLVVTFSKPMDTSSLAYDVSPDPGGWLASWNGNGTAVTLTHNLFEYNQLYTVTLSANDMLGFPLVSGPVPNPWTFTTSIGAAPTILATIPVDGETGIPITQSLEITFSEPVITSTLDFTVTPNAGIWSVTWNPGSTALVLTPETALLYDQTYGVEVNVQGVNGLWLAPGIVPNPWSFNTIARTIFELLLPLIYK